MTRAFVVRPFGKKKDSSGKELDFERVHEELIGPALTAANLGGGTTGEIVDAGNVREDMFSLILEADLVICDITIHNANVFYELGIRHALRKRHTVLIKGDAADSTPFDVLTDRYLSYKLDEPATARNELIEMIRATLRSDRETDSPVFRMLPGLAERDPSAVQVVPLDFIEEVERARAARSKGWLRLLAQEVRERRFQWIALELVAKAQWALRDYEGARESLEALREAHRDRAATNLTLANIYERLHRASGKPELLKASDLAIDRVLASGDVTFKERVEALALRGRNEKTGWRRGFESLDSLAERRRAAMNQSLRDSYKAYRDTFFQDLNHFYPGVAALQMAIIFLDLSKGEDDGWKSSFDADEQADAYRTKLVREIEDLRVLVSASIEAALLRLTPKDSDFVWAEISKVDLLFLAEKAEQRVINRYKDVIPKDDPFAWDASKGQLGLFANLGIRAQLAAAVIDAVDSQMGELKRSDDKPIHLILFAGHRVDEPGRPKPRFPAEREDRARGFIRDALTALSDGSSFQGLASAAPGADILFHEVCLDLAIPTKLCLPMPAEHYARLAFNDLDDWRSRFLRFIGETPESTESRLLVLSDRDGLPRWLQGVNTDPWERGNRWVLQMALTAKTSKITLVALWDFEHLGDARGGTAHMVQLARDSGRVHVKVIDARKLLEP